MRMENIVRAFGVEPFSRDRPAILRHWSGFRDRYDAICEILKRVPYRKY